MNAIALRRFARPLSPPPPRPTSTLDLLRLRAVQSWAAIGWITLALLLVVDLLLGAGKGWPLLVTGVAINAAPTLMAIRGRFDVHTRTIMGSLAAILPAMLVFLLQGAAWQMDAHMYFFVAIAALVMLADWRPIALAAGLIAAHHLLFELLVPAWVFTGRGNLGRVAFHATAVVLQCGVLGYLTVKLERLIATQDATIDRSRELLDAAESERCRAVAAMEQARVAEADAARERAARGAIAARLRTERRQELVVLADRFEGSVTSMVRAIATTTERLAASAVRLDEITVDAGGAADGAAQGAARAAAEIAQVAASVRDLSESIRTIAVAAGDQSGLTESASGEASQSVATITALEEQAKQIESLVEDIRQIAGKTNLLALNATIEAARAGEAGHGFTVVAGEVKTLAGDATRASDKISALLTAIRAGVAATGVRLRGVDEAIGKVAVSAGSIASAAATQRNSASDVEASTRRAALSAADVERQLGQLATAAGVAAGLSVEVRDSAGDLASSARDLRASTDRFVSFLHEEDSVPMSG